MWINIHESFKLLPLQFWLQISHTIFILADHSFRLRNRLPSAFVSVRTGGNAAKLESVLRFLKDSEL